MANLTKRRVWGNLGIHIDEPDTALQDRGYEPLEQPFNEHHNWIWNSRDIQTNHLLNERNFWQRFAPSLSIERQVSGQFEGAHNITHPYSELNAIQNTDNPVCICPAWDYSVNRPCVYVGFVDIKTGIRSYRNDDTGNIIVTDIPLDFGSVTEYPEAIVSEGEAFYVMTKGATPNAAKFYRFSANPMSSTPVWTWTDTETKFRPMRNSMCIAGDYLAYLRTDVSPTGDLVQLVRKSDAGAGFTGNGNATGLGSTYRAGWSIVSNGQSVFFPVYDSAGIDEVYLCGADISNPTVATYPGGSWARKMLGGSKPNVGSGDVIFDGQLVHTADTRGYIWAYNWNKDSWNINDAAQWHLANAKYSPDRQEHLSMCFDGLRGYVLAEFDGLNNSNNAFVSPVNLADSSLDAQASDTPYEVNPPSTSQIMIEEPLPADPASYHTRIVYSDNSLWLLPQVNAISAVKNTIIRIPNIWARR